MKLTTTLNKIRACSPCASGYRKLVRHLGDDFAPDAQINLLTILESNGVADAAYAADAADAADAARENARAKQAEIIRSMPEA